jgi:D-3-phosphoglycerate dehydrogenase / 2-oxoglutarate reductase
MGADRPVVAALGPVDPALVTGALGDDVRFVPDPSEADLATAAGAIVRADAVVDAAFLGRVPRLRVLARTGVGVDLVDLPAASARGIPVVITPGSGARAVAEGVLALALHLVKRLGPLTELVRQGRWAQRGQVPVGDLEGGTIGIVGYGRIGRQVGELATAFRMRVLAYDPLDPPPGQMACPELAELATASDVLTLHVPLTKQTQHLVDATLLDRVRPGAVLVNCGRGGLLDLDAALAVVNPAGSRAWVSTCSSPNRRGTIPSSRPPERRTHSACDGADPSRHGRHLRRRGPRRPRRSPVAGRRP